MSLAGGTSDVNSRLEALVRLEPRCRDDDFSGGIEARTADPLWMLARQWQTGELTGEDAASPIEVRLQYATQTPEKVQLGDAEQLIDLINFDEGKQRPLETLVEQEQNELSWRERIQIGQEFEQIALIEIPDDAPVLIHACRMQYPITIDSREQWVNIDRATRRILKLSINRVADGKYLLEALREFMKEPPNNSTLILPTGVSKEQLSLVHQKLEDWCKRLNLTLNSDKPPAWRNQQLDYRFEINPPPKANDENPAPLKNHLIAPDYRNGALDWYSFNIASSTEENWDNQPEIVTLPAPISIGGTSPRWWAFEDSATNFGKLDIKKTDIAKLLLMEFTLIYGDDWFSVPLPVKMPNLVKVKQLNVLDVFGDTEEIPQARICDPDPMKRFEMFTLSPVENINQPAICDPSKPGMGSFLWLPPMAGYREESSPLEEINFLRDEGANMVWGVEHKIQNGMGRSIDGFDAQNERIERREEEEIFQLEIEMQKITQQLKDETISDDQRLLLLNRTEQIQQRLTRLREGPQIESNGMPQFRLATTVPENWIPFAAMNSENFTGYKSIRLRRAQMLRNVDDEEPEPIEAMSRLFDMEYDPLLWLEEASVPRSGVKVQLTGQRVRWIDGKTYVWLGRKVMVGKGEGSSGLTFDFIQDYVVKD